MSIFDEDPAEAFERLQKERDILNQLNELDNPRPKPRFTASEWESRRKRAKLAKSSRRKNRRK